MKQKQFSDQKNIKIHKTDMNEIRALVQQNDYLMKQIADRLNNRNQVIQLEHQFKAEKKQFLQTNRKVDLLNGQLEKIRSIVSAQKLQQKQEIDLNKSQLQKRDASFFQQTLDKKRSKSQNIRNCDVSVIKQKIRKALKEVMYEFLD